eukprot:CAMPEP_0177623748 /NCGR_PEP_ID=MMETSP0419_2-20121207/29079_1 /TAXON_ID=582737 /ORGANISM="Tetraselmis sp., Strain GSL018" /LENGTH=487 /DNA_ID=CAMNT_0019124343 /DNA_START=376 /DNA_END=1841 /DNA_ORIENTATION=+
MLKADNTYNCSSIRNSVHVMYSSDSHEYQALFASVISAMQNSKQPERLRFHIVVPWRADRAELCTKLARAIRRGKQKTCAPRARLSVPPPATEAVPSCPILQALRRKSFRSPEHLPVPDQDPGPGERDLVRVHERAVPHRQLQRRAILFPALEDPDLVQVSEADESLLRKELMSNVNFARNFADDILLPFGVEKMMYLDVDTIVQGDIVRLIADTNLTGSKFFAAVASCKQHMEQWFDFSSSLVRRTMKRRDCYINAGVYIVHLPMYREAAIQARILQLIGAHQRHRLWLQGVHQPSFVLALYNYTMLLDRRWNVAGLGWISNMDEALLKSAHVLHWSGAHKPWQCDGFYRSYWDPYGVPPKNCPAQPYPGRRAAAEQAQVRAPDAGRAPPLPRGDHAAVSRAVGQPPASLGPDPRRPRAVDQGADTHRASWGPPAGIKGSVDKAAAQHTRTSARLAGQQGQTGPEDDFRAAGSTQAEHFGRCKLIS